MQFLIFPYRLFHTLIMGKRSRRRNPRKHNPICKQVAASEAKFFVTSMEPFAIDQNSEAGKLLKQVRECINEIYSEHVNDLEQRKQKRLASKVPTDIFQPYNLVVNSAYQQRIKTQIQELKVLQYDSKLRDALLYSTDIFLDYLRKHVREFDGKKGLLQVIILYESYHTLQNSITQIGAIVDEVLSRGSFELILKKKFHNTVASDYYELIDSVVKKEQSEYIDDVLRLKEELENISKRGEDDKQLITEFCFSTDNESYSEEESTVEAYHNLPIDELVKIISLDQKKKNKKMKKKSPVSTKENSASPDRETFEIDMEIENFKQRLELEKPMIIKYQPTLSEEFLARLRQQLKINRV